MIQTAYRCPRCEQTVRGALSDVSFQMVCPQCDQSLAVAGDTLREGQIHRCVVCSGTDLFVRKDFPQRLGVSIVVLGFAASCVTWYHHQVIFTFGVLFATAFIDVLLYLLMPDLLECYRCHTQYRGVANLDQHAPFALETHEKYRQLAARTAGQENGHITTGST